MAHEDLREKLRAVVAEIAEIDEVPDDVAFKELGIDSMMAIEIIAEVERSYGIKVPEDELQKVRDLNSVVELVSSKLKK
ncbi:MAG TPA: acyl carrier protein [Polyangiales bacterium]|jgi:acyl carrier protein|nr:acyl carrier protein [Polyangiales bacterium]